MYIQKVENKQKSPVLQCACTVVRWNLPEFLCESITRVLTVTAGAVVDAICSFYVFLRWVCSALGCRVRDSCTFLSVSDAHLTGKTYVNSYLCLFLS
jgi:hypothetical protein